MQAVSREDVGLAVDVTVVRRYLHARQRADAGELSAERRHECKVQRLAAICIALVERSADLAVRPRGVREEARVFRSAAKTTMTVVSAGKKPIPLAITCFR